MSPPTHYNRLYNFTNYQALYPTAPPPGNELDAELSGLMAAVNATMDSLALIQKSDSTVANASIGPAQLSSQLTTGFTPPTIWVTGGNYTASPASCVLNGTSMYICLVSHVAGTFATDLANGLWQLIFNLSTLTFGTASAIAVSLFGSNITTNVQTSLDNLDSNKAATSHTHTASQISDSTSVGRTLLTAANLAAQQTALGLGTLAFLNTINVTAIPGNLAFTGKQSAAVAVSVNDYSPTGWATNAIFELTAGSASTVTGLLATTDGDIKILDNVGTNNINLTANDPASAAANRLIMPFTVPLPPGTSLTFKYDGAAPGWRCISPIFSRSGGAGASFRNLVLGNVAGPNGFTPPGTPNTQYRCTVDEIVLANANGDKWGIVSPAAVTADLAVSGANGLDTGAIAVNTGYYFWLIGAPNAGGGLAGLWSLSATAPTMPSGYTFKARVGWGHTNGSSQLQRVLQLGRRAQYVVSASVTTQPPIIANSGGGAAGTYSPTSPTLALISINTLVPATASAIKIAATNTWESSSNGGVLVAPNINWGGTNNGPIGSNGLVWPINLSNAGTASSAQSAFAEFLLEGTTIAWATSTTTAAVACLGWEDNI